MINEKLGIYIHIPFCVKKCNYCDFNSGVYSDSIKSEYIDALCKEIECKSDYFKNYKIDTIFMGGGTPSILPVDLTGRVFDTLRSFYNVNEDAEITIESNPGTLDADKLKAYRGFGINRISIGLQSTDKDQLKILGRIHTYEDFEENYNNAREAGFDNINIDLISAVPGQDLRSFSEGLNKVKSLDPEHISIYSLIIEEGTPFYEMKPDLPDEDSEREMIHCIPEILGDEYSQYEISNYAKKGFECRHNIKYWNRDAYLGFGVSAASLLKTNGICNLRLKNTDNITEYIEILKNLKEDVTDVLKTDYIKSNNFVDFKSGFYNENFLLGTEDIKSEYMILGLRMNRGISKKDFTGTFEKDIYEIFGNEINKHLKEGLLEDKEGYIYLTKKGRDLANYVWKDFI
ncbi:MAG: radical SAM family heme chaperone HemW [Lachnospiraceae bacterium]|nr:radical SAM family heme chaperone HemW [Lachnospiraceae bacterium]